MNAVRGAHLQFKTAASVTQNRESQRRSRARNRELLSEMRNKLGEYERGGIQASLDMQCAARRIARENYRLRMMLTLHGVLPAEIEAFLSLPDEQLERTPSAVAESIPHHRRRLLTLHGQPGLGTVPVSAQDESVKNPSTAADGQRSCRLPLNFDCRVMDLAPTSGTGLATSYLGTPCKVAASIIAEVQGHRDAAQALVDLGCSGVTDCLVNNNTIFQLIDKAV